MRALVVYESMFGNTRQVAQAIVDGLAPHVKVELVEVGNAPDVIAPDVSLLIVGGPTHAFGMSRASTRLDAATRTTVRLISPGVGVREWLEGVQPPDHPVMSASFDTHVDKPRILRSAGSAAVPIARRLESLGCGVAADPEHFWVADTLGPLRDGELERAQEWGSLLAGRAASVLH
ncbi:MAG: flavodoxin [Thermoleophilia bacterium]|nr:flavodoxin [Thermoleophilia bacterium]